MTKRETERKRPGPADARPIIITGAARSGLSVVAGVLHCCGAWGGKIYPKTGRYTFDNPQLHGLLVRPFLHGLRVDPRCQESLPKIQQVFEIAPKIAPEWRRRALDVLRKQHCPFRGPWMYKSSVAAAVWPLWALAFPEAAWVIVRRNRAAVINACIKTGYMDGRTTIESWGEWYDAFEARMSEIDERSGPVDPGNKLTVYNLWPARILRGDTKDARSVVESLNLSWNQQAVADFLAPARWESGIFGARD